MDTALHLDRVALLQVRITEKERKLYRAAAKAEGMLLSEFVRDALRRRSRAAAEERRREGTSPP